MVCNQFRAEVIIPCIPQVQRIITSQLFSGVTFDLQKGDEDEGGAEGWVEIAM